ncbi:MAG: FAD-dependent oxidoreductase [Chloroflexota bacterium]|nr:FAD-dependent oxidoreductase [Chloroflexota bacterium]
MAQSSEVVIVGGGVAGCATAYFLSLAGVKATIIEREGISSQASGFSAGGLNPLEGSCIPGPLSALAMASFKLHKELWGPLRRETGIDFQSRIVSLTKVAFSEDEVPALQESMSLFEDARLEGFSGEWLHRSEALKVEPRLSERLIGGVRLFGNATLNSLLYTQTLADAAQKNGATIRPGVARGVRLDNGRVLSVILADGEITCDQLVLAAGPWSREAEQWLDFSVPVDPLKGEILRLEMHGPALGGDLNGAGASVYPRADGLVWCGTTEVDEGFNREPTEAAKEKIWGAARELIPELAHATLIKHTACLRPITPDYMPIVGRAPGWDNVYLATGAGKKGILLSTGMGKATADLMTEDVTDVPLEGCEPERFAPSMHSESSAN